jgi:hypothetical protein
LWFHELNGRRETRTRERFRYSQSLSGVPQRWIWFARDTGKAGKQKRKWNYGSILDAIIAGERDPRKLASLAHYRVQKSQAQIEAALTGDSRVILKASDIEFRVEFERQI